LGPIKRWWRAKRPEILVGPLYAAVNVFLWSFKTQAEGFPEDDSKMIFCGWHGRSFVFGGYCRDRSYTVLISQSRDGDIQNTMFTRLGYKTIRGSTSRGGVRALIEAIRELKRGGTMAMTPDGPRGPSGIVQGGVMMMAQRSGAGLVPVGITAKPRRIVNSWDRYVIPYPFAKCLIICGEPIYVAEDASDDEVERCRLLLESECHRLQDVAEKRFGVTTPPPPPPKPKK